MLSSNSFNLCPHCGNSNTLNARFCSRCGTQLKVPEEVVVCRNCGTRNSPMANFCRNCGSQLKVGEQTKICPRCRNEVPAGDNTCACGYSFATIATTAPVAAATPVDVREGKKGKKAKKQKGPKAGKAVVSKKGGSVLALFALLFLLVFGYFFAAPQEARLDFLAFDQGLITLVNGTVLYGLYYIILIVTNIIAAISTPGGDVFQAILGAFGGSVAEIILSVMTIIFAISVVSHLIVCITRIFSSKRSKRANGLYLALAILTTIATALIILPQFMDADFLGGFLSIFALSEGVTLGWVVCAIPAYYWFFFIYSAIAKGKTLAEEVA